jgi:phosphate starvation-inducible PhoH-like protein
MSEKIINIETIHPLDIFGANDQNLEVVRNFYPKLKIVSRDNYVKAFGEEADLLDFEAKFTTILLYFEKFGRLTKSDITHLLDAESNGASLAPEGQPDILVHGKNGLLVRARTPNQQKLV